MRPRSSTPRHLTQSLSPSLHTPSIDLRNLSLNSLMWQRPSMPGRISTKAPNALTPVTVPS